MNDILLIGIADTKHKIREIVKYSTITDMEKYYGKDSKLVEAFRILKGFGVDDIFTLNLESWDDLKSSPELLRDSWFRFIVPVDLKLTDSYNDILNDGAKYYYSQLLTWMSYDTPSTIIITGNHASGFETLDAFLENENNEVTTIKSKLYNLQTDNLIYVANCLIKYKYANAVLAAMLLGDLDKYPTNSDLGHAVFDIYYSDIENNVVFFKNNYLRETTLENLVNFSENPLNKLVTVNRIIKYFMSNRPDFSDIIGTGFSEYKKVKINERMTAFLKNLVGWIIYSYKINSITSVKNDDATVSIYLHYDIWPKFTTEKYTMTTTL